MDVTPTVPPGVLHAVLKWSNLCLMLHVHVNTLLSEF
uniref:Uncharacterized protein n=1 Tax=Anguilla anguilla TaxID=7936 RepID=A0A0E9W4F2_ANGAN